MSIVFVTDSEHGEPAAVDVGRKRVRVRSNPTLPTDVTRGVDLLLQPDHQHEAARTRQAGELARP